MTTSSTGGRRRAYVLIGSTAAAATLLGCGLPPAGADPTRPAPKAPANGTATAIRAELAKARVTSTRSNIPGYERKCGTGHACSFGKAWTDKHTGLGARNGCDTRNDVLAAQLNDIRHRSGSKCVVESGTLNDPYTGREIKFRKQNAAKVQIDHVYALSRAWDMGAAGWKPQRRTDFANDQTRNLLAVDGATNASKGDKGPGEWMPIAAGYRCTWVLSYLKVANTYGLAITRDDRDAAQTITRSCSSKEATR